MKLLWNFETGGPTDIARRWREKLRFVFVDEYQDINAAQDKIIQALSRDERWGETPVEPISTNADVSRGRSPHHANRFLVGDVKQSIYRFRLADPKIFRDYAKNWRGKDGQTIPLAENFRSRESLLSFVNSVFEPLMRREIGGVNYDDEAKLKFGSPETRPDFSAAKDPSPRAELLLRFKTGRGEEPSDGENGGDLADLEESEKEARLLALRLKELEKSGHKIWDDEEKVFRAAKWSDMAVLLRSPAGKAEVFAKAIRTRRRAAGGCARRFFRWHRNSGFVEPAGTARQSVAGRSGHRRAALAARRLFAGRTGGNPARREGCSFLDGAEPRWSSRGSVLRRRQSGSLNSDAKFPNFSNGFPRWRKLARQASLSQCLDEILAETHYGDWLRTQPRGAQRRANVEQFLNLAQKFDQFQRQGLFRFLKFIEAQREAGVEPEAASGSGRKRRPADEHPPEQGAGISGGRHRRSGEDCSTRRICATT